MGKHSAEYPNANIEAKNSTLRKQRLSKKRRRMKKKSTTRELNSSAPQLNSVERSSSSSSHNSEVSMNQNNNRKRAHSESGNTCRTATHSMWQRAEKTDHGLNAMHSHFVKRATSHPTPATSTHTQCTHMHHAYNALELLCSCALRIVLSILLLFTIRDKRQLRRRRRRQRHRLCLHTNALWEFFGFDCEMRSLHVAWKFIL